MLTKITKYSSIFPMKKGKLHMENILDILYEYSKKGKKIDKKVINKVIKILIIEKDLSDFVKRTRFKNIYKTEPDKKDIPMAYWTKNKEILLDKNKIRFFQNNIEDLIQFKDFEHTLSCNAMLTQVALHEIEHANQVKKSIIIDEEFENLLLGVCLHVDNEFFKESKISQFLINKLKIYSNPQLYYNIRLMRQINNQFNTSTPIERMANIHSTQEVKEMLTIISKSEYIENVISLFDTLLMNYQLNGYNYNNGIITSPTQSYLEEIKKLNITGMECHFNERFSEVMEKSQNDSLEKRLLLGLDISEEEYQKTKTKISQKAR